MINHKIETKQNLTEPLCAKQDAAWSIPPPCVPIYFSHSAQSSARSR